MYICIYIYIYIYVYMYICIYVYMYICIYVYMYICIKEGYGKEGGTTYQGVGTLRDALKGCFACEPCSQSIASFPICISEEVKREKVGENDTRKRKETKE